MSYQVLCPSPDEGLGEQIGGEGEGESGYGRVEFGPELGVEGFDLKALSLSELGERGFPFCVEVFQIREIGFPYLREKRKPVFRGE